MTGGKLRHVAAIGGLIALLLFGASASARPPMRVGGILAGHVTASGGGGAAQQVGLGSNYSASGTTLSITTTNSCRAGDVLLVGAYYGSVSNDTNTTVSDGNSETWGATTLTSQIADNVKLFSAVLTTAISTSATITLTIDTSREKMIWAACLDGIAIDKKNSTKAASGTPQIDVPASGSLSSQPQYVALLIFGDDALDNTMTVSGYTKLEERYQSGFGGQIWYKRVTSTSQTTPALTGFNTTKHWHMHATTMTSP